jgi:hypothetical protein
MPAVVEREITAGHAEQAEEARHAGQDPAHRMTGLMPGDHQADQGAQDDGQPGREQPPGRAHAALLPTMPGTLPADRSGIVIVKIFQAERARGSRLQLPF